MGSIALDVLVGVILIFFVLSVACSAVVEAISAKQKWRARDLKDSLTRLLGNDCCFPTADEFLQHALVAPSIKAGDLAPAYVSAQTFADVVLDMLARSPVDGVSYRHFRSNVLSRARRDEFGKDPGLPKVNGRGISPKFAEAMGALADAVERQVPDGEGADAQRLVLVRGQIERWYDQTMERTTGLYKQRVQKCLLITAAIAVLALNVDTIAITRHLIASPGARQALAAMADQQVKEGNNTAQLTTGEAVKRVQELAAAELPLGWARFGKEFSRQTGSLSPDEDASHAWRVAGFMLMKLAGLVVTIFAVSLGAPFWFDVLSKVSSLRTAGKKPAESLATKAASSPDAAMAAGDIAAAAGAGPGAAPSAALTGTTGSSSARSIGIGSLPSREDYWALPARAHDFDAFKPRDLERYEKEMLEALPADKQNDPDSVRQAKAEALVAAEKADESRKLVREAAFMAKLADLAYLPEYVIRRITDNWKFNPEHFKFLDCKGTQGFIASDDKMIVVSFRGTEPTVLHDILADAKIALMDRFNGKVHGGFSAALDCVLDEAMTHLAKVDNGRGLPIWITGHSLGAALATLFAAELHRRGGHNVRGLHTFGSPRVGDENFVRTYGVADRCVRFIHNEDLVTRVAPRTFGYAHVGEIRYIDAHGKMHNGDDMWVRFLNTVVTALDDFKAAAKTSVKDHSMANYVLKLENLRLST